MKKHNVSSHIQLCLFLRVLILYLFRFPSQQSTSLTITLTGSCGICVAWYLLRSFLSMFPFFLLLCPLLLALNPGTLDLILTVLIFSTYPCYEMLVLAFRECDNSVHKLKKLYSCGILQLMEILYVSIFLFNCLPLEISITCPSCKLYILLRYTVCHTLQLTRLK